MGVAGGGDIQLVILIRCDRLKSGVTCPSVTHNPVVVLVVLCEVLYHFLNSSVG